LARRLLFVKPELPSITYKDLAKGDVFLGGGGQTPWGNGARKHEKKMAILNRYE